MGELTALPATLHIERVQWRRNIYRDDYATNTVFKGRLRAEPVRRMRSIAGHTSEKAPAPENLILLFVPLSRRRCTNTAQLSADDDAVEIPRRHHEEDAVGR